MKGTYSSLNEPEVVARWAAEDAAWEAAVDQYGAPCVHEARLKYATVEEAADFLQERLTALVPPEPVDIPVEPDEFFTDRGSFVPQTLALRLLEQTPIRVGPDGVSLWVYRRGVFREDIYDCLGRRIGDALGDKWRPANSASTRQWLRENTERINVDRTETRLLNVRNGMLDWRSGDLIPHDAAYGSTAQIPWEWDDASDCPRFRSTFAHLEPGVLELIFEIVGYVLYPGNPMKKAVLLHGPTDTGKSTLLDVTRAVVGSRNVSAVALQALADERFARADLYGKLANICGDLDARAVRTSDTFKMLTGGDEVTAERKGRDPFKFVNRATLLFSANELPKTQDQSDAWFGRFLVIPMMHKPADIDPKVKASLPNDRNEMQGVLRFAVEGLRLLMARGQFAPPASVVEAGLSYRDAADSVRGFFQDDRWICDAGDAWLPRTPVYQGYREWCRDNGRLPVSAETFYGKIESDGLGLGLRLSKRERGTVRAIVGLRRSNVGMPAIAGLAV